MKKRFSGMWRSALLVLTVLVALGLSGCTREEAAESSNEFSIAVFVPGIVAGSPIYEMLVEGVRRAASEHEGTQTQIIEGGSSQGEWQQKVSALAASGSFDVIVTSNPAMPAICDAVSQQFPNQRFIIFDGYLEGNENIHTLRYDQYQQAYLIGHQAGLVTTSTMEGANEELVIGLIAGQEYPDMNDQILPGYLAGAREVNGQITVDFRVVGNWYDATKGAELTRSIASGGADVILCIAGGANQGVLTAAEELGIYVLWYDSNGYGKAPGTVVGSTSVRQDLASYETVKKAIEGSLVYGTARQVGIKEGYITFIDDDSDYEAAVPQSIRSLQKGFVER